MICNFICKTPCNDSPCVIHVPCSANNHPGYPNCCPFDNTLKVKFEPATEADLKKWNEQWSNDELDAADSAEESARVAEWEAIESRRSCRD